MLNLHFGTNFLQNCNQFYVLNSVSQRRLLHLSALERALPLFCHSRTNYARWGSLYYKGCLKLPTKFPDIYEEFQRGSLLLILKRLVLAWNLWIKA